MWLKDYWALFATQVLETKDLTILQNLNLPMLEVNAGYGKDVLLLQTQAKNLKRPALLVSSRTPEFGKILVQGVILEWQTQLVSSSVYIEQVPWTQANALAQSWCERHGAVAWHGLVSLEITRVMQKYPELCAYLALEHEQPIGMLLVMPKNGWWHDGTPVQWFSNQPQGAVSAWWAGRPEVLEALFDRASTDFLGLEVSLPLEMVKPQWRGANTTEFAVFGFDEQP